MKKMVMVRQLHTDKVLLIVIDLCQPHYQNLLTTCQKLIRIAKHAWQEKKIMSECILIGIEDNKLSYKCKECNDKSYRSIKGLIKKFPSVYQFVLLLRKGVYPYEYMDSWEKFDKTSLPPKEAFYS